MIRRVKLLVRAVRYAHYRRSEEEKALIAWAEGLWKA